MNMVARSANPVDAQRGRAANGAFLEVESASVSYGSVRVLDDLSLHLERG